MERSLWESVATAQWIVENEEVLELLLLGWGAPIWWYFFKAIKADEGYGGQTGPSDGIGNMKNWQISTEEEYSGLTGPSDGLSNKKHWYQVRRKKMV